MRDRRALAVLLLTLAACATPAKTHYYSLSPESPPAAQAPGAAPAYRVAIGPATVPEAVDRAQIVLRLAPNRYAIADAERWAQPLTREIPRVLAAEIARRLPAAQVASESQYGGQSADFRVWIDVLRFESVPGESATLEVAWSVRGRSGARLREARSLSVEKAGASGVAALVAAHAKGLAATAQDISAALAALAEAKH